MQLRNAALALIAGVLLAAAGATAGEHTLLTLADSLFGGLLVGYNGAVLINLRNAYVSRNS